jgi:entericidin A
MNKLLVLVFCMSFLTGCNTVQGFGQDVKKVGEKMENAAKK